jgi:hypothetical protein
MMFIDWYADGYLFTGSKHLEYISSITIMNNDYLDIIDSKQQMLKSGIMGNIYKYKVEQSCWGFFERESSWD